MTGTVFGGYRIARLLVRKMHGRYNLALTATCQKMVQALKRGKKP